MQLISPFKITQACRNKFCEHIIESSAPTSDFYLLVVLSTLIVAMGLLIDNVILVIGGMLVTPLLSPLLAIALGVVIKEGRVIIRSFKIFLFSSIAAIMVAFSVGIISSHTLHNLKLISIMEPSLLIILIAIIAGFAASYTWAKPELNVTLAGIAVTVTIIPPLAAIGLTFANGEWVLFKNTLNTFLINAFGIFIASLILFYLMDFYKAKSKVIEEVKEEEKVIKKEKQEAVKEKLKVEKEKIDVEKEKLRAERKKLEIKTAKEKLEDEKIKLEEKKQELEINNKSI